MDDGAPALAQTVQAQTVHAQTVQAQTMLSSSLPPPTPEQQQFVDHVPQFEQPKRAGELSSAWRVVFGFGWAAIIIGYAAVWETSRVIGLSTWWLGADAEPHLLVVQLVPFYGPIVVTIGAAANWRHLPYLGMAAAAIGVAVAAGDLGRVQWLATVEFVLAGAALCISVASLAGMYRTVRPAEPVR